MPGSATPTVEQIRAEHEAEYMDWRRCWQDRHLPTVRERINALKADDGTYSSVDVGVAITALLDEIYLEQENPSRRPAGNMFHAGNYSGSLLKEMWNEAIALGTLLNNPLHAAAVPHDYTTYIILAASLRD